MNNLKISSIYSGIIFLIIFFGNFSQAIENQETNNLILPNSLIYPTNGEMEESTKTPGTLIINQKMESDELQNKRELHESFLANIQTGGIARIFFMLNDLSGTTTTNKSGLILTTPDFTEIFEKPQIKQILNLIDASNFTETNGGNLIPLVSFLLHNDSVSDEDILKLIKHLHLSSSSYITVNDILNKINPTDVPLDTLLPQQESVKTTNTNGSPPVKKSKKGLKESKNKTWETQIDNSIVTYLSYEILASHRIELMKKYFKTNKINFEFRNELGDTPLHILAKNKKITEKIDLENLMSILEKKNPKINFNIQNNESLTPLAMAALSGNDLASNYFVHLETVDINIKDKYNRTAMMIAKENNHHSIADDLLQKKTKDSYFNIENWTAVKDRPDSLNFSFYNLINDLTSTMEEKWKHKPRFIIQRRHLIQNLFQVMLESEQRRTKSIEQLSTLTDVLSTEFYFLIQAIQDENLRYISHVARHNKELFQANFLVPVDQTNSAIVTNSILEAVRTNNPEVFFLIKQNVGSGFATIPNELPLVTLDPLSQAVYISTLFDDKISQEKERNLQIINMIMEEGFDPNYKNYLGLDAMEWALITGAEDMIKRLHEINNIPLPLPKNTDPFNLGIKYEELAFHRQSLDLYKYLTTAQQMALLDSACAGTFMH